MQPRQKILINELSWFHNKDFKNRFASGQNFSGFSDAYKARFDQLLQYFVHSDLVPDQDDAINDLGTDRPDPEIFMGKRYSRDPRVRSQVLIRAKGNCEFCGTLGFECERGDRYLESHHIIKLADEGADRMTNVIALCPNHHREAHYGVSRNELEARMAQIVHQLEFAPPMPA
jgi:predicted restriction endonuclease